ncbi:hypothetical protein PHMEG_00013785 [Phytophthora megakarya]|uniref:Uncharacterized protein n=1 Tax=Phytophthora megakarya TaxID=4795 RepID=A0A225W5G0_9STRA|nr:hypothetical protein PHMEG_00013785 [Phytophthora megakarya]
MAEHLLGDAPLRGLLSLLFGHDSAAQREASSLSLVANFRHVAPSAALQTLQSLMAMESYSHSLQRYPLVKQAFWEQVLASDLMVGTSTICRQQLQLRDERFPRLILDFSRCKVTTELLESLRRFLADPELQSQFPDGKVERDSGASVRVVPVTLKLIRCRLTPDLIDRLTTLLLPEWREYEDSKRRDVMAVRYRITSLDLSENAMKTAELIALAELLNECGRRSQRRGETPLEELVLENALGLALTTEKWAAFRAFIGAAFGVTGDDRTSLKRLSLANNALGYRHVGCICSALRYEGTALEDLSLAHTFSLVDPVDRKTCWQWLAIGLRPMTPRNGRSGLRRLDLSGNPIFPMDSDAWLESLRDPHTTVMHSTELYSLPSEASSRLHIVEKEVKAASLEEWEVLGSRDGEPTWLCVLIPGFGVMWTQGKHAMSWEHTESRMAPASAVLSELIMNDMATSLTTAEALESFLRGFGGRLQSLELRRNALSAMDLDTMLVSCQQLHTLDVEGCRILQLQLLVDALSGDLGRHLRTLNLNANLVGADSVNVLAAALLDRAPVLQELRMAHNEIGANGVRHLHAVLETNKTLMLLEMDLPNESADTPQRPDDDEYIQLYRTRCMRLDVSFQNELLGITPLLVNSKFAFLLVLNVNDVVLDPGICRVIFTFAADEKRRRILWNSSHR